MFSWQHMLTSRYHEWLEESAAFLKQLDPNHLVSLGSEGPTPWPDYVNNDLRLDHGGGIDYVTVRDACLA